jgi:hypothetical protein
MEENRITLRKIPIELIIGLLEQLFEQGYDYFDIEGNAEEEQDFVKIAIKPEYFSKEMEEGEEEDIEEHEDDVPKKLSDEDLNQLI